MTMAGDKHVCEGQNRKITDYFKVISNKPLYCLENYCKYEREDEMESGAEMIACDLCDAWFHIECVVAMPGARPIEDKNVTWFCSDCKSVFTNFNSLKKEIKEIKNKLCRMNADRNKIPPHKNKDSSIDVHPQKSQSKMAEEANSKPKPMSFADSNSFIILDEDSKALSDEVRRLKEENANLATTIKSMQTFIEQLLAEKEPSNSNEATTSKNGRQSYQKNAFVKPAQNNVKDSNNKQKKKNKKAAILSPEIRENKEDSGDSVAQKVLIIGDSHIKRLDPDKMKEAIPLGIGGLKSDQVLKNKEIADLVDSNIQEVEEVIVHVGCNDLVSRSPQVVVTNIDNISKKLKERNPHVNVSISEVLYRKDKSHLNVKVVQTNDSLKKFCLQHGFDFITHGNIGFKHLDKYGLHLNSDGSRLFARNFINHIKNR